MKKSLFCLLCLSIAAPSALAAGNCTGHIWAADIDQDCRVHLSDFSQIAKDYGFSADPYPDPCAAYGTDDWPYGDNLGTTVSVDFTPAPADPIQVTIGGEARVGLAESWKVYIAQRETPHPTGGEFWEHTGEGTVTFDNALPAGDYFVHAWWSPASWANGQSFSFKFGGTGVTEHGTDYPGEFHTIWPTTTTGEPVLVTEFVGPTMADEPSTLTHFNGGTTYVGTSKWQGSNNFPGTYLTLEPGNQVVFTLDENCFTNYGRTMFYGLYFIPAIVPEPSGPPEIIVQTEDCNTIWTPHVDDPCSYVRVTAEGAHVMASTGENDMGRGTARFTIPDTIPDGDYTVLVALTTGAMTNPGNGGYWTIKLGATTGSVVENNGGDGTAHTWNSFVGDTLPNHGYQSWFASPAGSNGWHAPIWDAGPGGPLPTSVTLSGIGTDDLYFEIQDMMPENYTTTFFDYFKFIPVPELSGDVNSDNVVDIYDLHAFADQWLNCNDADDVTCTDIFCNAKPDGGLTEYIAYDVTTASPLSAVTVDGDLSDWPALDTYEGDPLWCTAKWIELDQVYYQSGGTDDFLEDVFMCIMYDADTDLVYGAVVAHDTDPLIAWGGAWDLQDNIEVYIRGTDAIVDPNDASPHGTWNIGQQVLIGLQANPAEPPGNPSDPNNDTTYARWPNNPTYSSIPTPGPDPGLVAVASRVVNGPWDYDLTYEFSLVPYDNYGGWDASTDVPTDLYSGKKFRYDVVLGNASPTFSGKYYMLCPNTQTSKAYNVNRYATVTCE